MLKYMPVEIILWNKNYVSIALCKYENVLHFLFQKCLEFYKHKAMVSKL